MAKVRYADVGWMNSPREWIRVGHRGVGKLFGPPNTLRAYRRALEFGVDMIEVDLRRAGDGTLVLAHDEEIHDDRLQLKLSDCSLDELRQVDLGSGERIPTLDEAV
jgi:glycerophosphoryl diester phosphodiesterase